MQPLFVEALGCVTPVGLNVPQTMGSLRTGLDFFESSEMLGSGAEPVVAASVPLVDGVLGLERNVVLLGLALKECTEGAALEKLPMFLCLPEDGGPDFDVRRILDGVQRIVGLELDVAQSAGFSAGRAALAQALLRAAAQVSTGRAEACYVAGVDSLLHRVRVEGLRARGRLKGGDSSDGIIPGEAGVCLRVSGRARTRALAWVRGVAHETAPGEPGRAGAVAAQVSAARKALALAQCSMGEIAFLGSDVTGERAFMQERALALTRLKPKRGPASQEWVAAQSVGDLGAAAGVLGLAYLSFRQALGAERGKPSLWMGASDGGARASVVVAPAPPR